MTRQIFFKVISFYLFSLYACGQKKLTIPEKFIETVQPKTGSEEWLRLNHSENEFKVENVAGQLEITKIKEGNSIKCESRVEKKNLIK